MRALLPFVPLAFVAACVAAPKRSSIDPVRIAVRSSEESAQELSTLSYKGGFETKTLIYETLVKRDSEGRIAPLLAQSWRFENGGKECVFELRQNARFHDGTAVTAQAVREHFKRWVGLPEHDWLSVNQHIVEVRAEGPRTLRIVMDEPHLLLPELCAINPCAVRAPSTLDFEGNFVKPVGSGPFAWDSVQEEGRVLRYMLRQRPGKDGLAVSYIELVRFVNEGPDVPVDELLAGRLDLVADSWRERIPRERIAALRANRRVRVIESPGSSVISLSFRTEAGLGAEESIRKAVQAAIDRKEIISRVENGYADSCSTLAAPCARIWPSAQTSVAAPPFKRPSTPLRLLAREDSDYQPALAKVIAEQLRRIDIPVKIVLLRGEAMSEALDSGSFEMRLESSWGLPYDPDISMNYRFGPQLSHPSSDNPPVWGRDKTIENLVVEAQKEWDEDRRTAVYSKIQTRLDESAILIPLYVPRRYAVFRADLPTPHLDNDPYRIDAISVAPVSVVRQP